MIEIIAVFLLICVVALVANAFEDHQTSIVFDPVYSDAGLPIVTLENNGKKLNFLVDTGANLCVLNERHAEGIDCIRLNGTGTMFGMEGNVQKVSYVRTKLSHNKTVFEVDFQVINVDAAFGRIEKDYNITVHGVLGTQFLEENEGKIDFIEHKLLYGKTNKAAFKRQNK